jgi:hypothetical protein
MSDIYEATDSIFEKRLGVLREKYPDAVTGMDQNQQQLTDSIYTRSLAQTFNDLPPEDQEDEAYKLMSSVLVSKMLRQDASTVYDNWDATVETWQGSKIRPKDFFDRTRMAWNSGVLNTQLGIAYSKKMTQEINGEDTAQIDQEIAAIEAKMPPSIQYKDILPRAFFGATEMVGQIVQNQVEGYKAGLPRATALAGTGAALAAAAGVAGPQALVPEEILTVPGLAGAMFTVGLVSSSVETMAKIEAGLAYKEMRSWKDENGQALDPAIMQQAAMAIGGVNGFIEFAQDVFLPGVGEIPKELLKKSLGEGMMKVFAKDSLKGPVMALAKRLGVDKAAAALGKAGAAKVLTETAKTAIGETSQEVAQEVVSVIGEEWSKALSNNLKGTQFEAARPEDIKERLVQVATDSVLSFGLYGAVAHGAKGAVSLAQGRGKINAQAKADVDAATPALKEIFGTPDGEAAVRTEKGDIYVQTRKGSTSAEGATAAKVLAGSPKTGEKYGVADYTIEGDTVRISDVTVDPTLADSDAVVEALIRKVAEDAPGLQIDVDTENEAVQAVVSRMTEQNPRGKEFGVQWYEADSDIGQVRDFVGFKQKMAQVFTKATTEQIDFTAWQVKQRAARVGMTPEAYIRKWYAPEAFTKTMPVEAERAVAAMDTRRNIMGTTVFRDSRALIYAAQSADFRTLQHEMVHSFFNEIEETQAEDYQTLSSAFGVVDEQGKARAWTDHDRERLAYSFEKYLETGQAENPAMRNILQKIVDWMVSTYRTIAGKMKVTPEIKAAFDQMFADPTSPISEAAQTVAEKAEQAPLFQEAQGARSVSTIIFKFPESLKAYSDIHSQAQVSGVLNVFGRGVVDAKGNMKIGDVGSSHAQLGQGMTDAKRFYFGYSREKQAVYVVAKNGMDESYIRSPAVLQKILSSVFDKYRLNVAQGKRLAFAEKEGPGVLFQYAGEGSELETKEKKSLSVAKAMQEKGESQETIRLATGWFQGKYDGKWRTEISDKSAFYFHADRLQENKAVRLGEILDYPELYKKYPEIKNVSVASLPKRDEAYGPVAALGEDRAGNKYLLVNAEAMPNQWELDKVIAHEIQHWIQEKEGFAKGANSDEIRERRAELKKEWEIVSTAYNMARDLAKGGSIDTIISQYEEINERPIDYREMSLAMNESVEDLKAQEETLRIQLEPLGVLSDKSISIYHLTAGEIEARDVESRFGLSDSQRKAIPPYSSENIPEKEAILFQLTDDEILKTARDSTDWKDFMGVLEAFGDNDEKTEGMSKEQKEAWYKEAFDRLRQDGEPDQKRPAAEADQEFRQKVSGRMGEFLQAIYYAILGPDQNNAPADAEEAALFDRQAEIQTRLEKDMHPTVKNAALTVGRGKELTERTEKAILTLMRKDGAVSEYRRWWAELMQDEELQDVDETATAEALPEIDDGEGRPRTSIEDRLRLQRAVKNEELRKKIATGEIVVDRDVAAYVKDLDEQKSGLEEKLATAQKDYQDIDGRLTTYEKHFRHLTRDLAEREKEIKAQDKELADLLEGRERAKDRAKQAREASAEKQASLFEALSSARKESRLAIKTIKEELAALKDKEVDQARVDAMDRAEAKIEEYKGHVKEIQDRKKEAKRIRDYKLELADRIMAKIPQSVAFEQREEIRALQKALDPHFRRARIKWKGEYLDIATLRDNPEFARDSGLSAEVIDMLSKRSLGEWSLADLEELARRIDDLVAMGRRKRDFEVLEWKRDRYLLTRGIINDVLAAGKYKPASASGSDERGKQLKKMDNFSRSVFLQTHNMARIANQLDGGTNGWNTKALVTDERAARAEKLRNMDRRIEKIQAEMKRLNLTPQDLYKVKKTITGIGPDKSDVTFTASDLMYIRIGLENKETRAAIMFGNLANQKERAETDRTILELEANEKIVTLQRAISEALTPEMIELTDLIGQDFEDEFGRMNDVFIKEFNNTMSQVAAYVPMIRQDTSASGEKHEKAQAEELLNVGGVSIKRSPDKGMTISRVKISPENQRAIKLDLYGTWLTAVERQEHFTAYTHYVRSLNAVYKGNSMESRSLRDTIVNSWGAGTMRYIEERITEIANPSSMDSSAGIDKIVRALRGNLGAAYLGWKTSGIVKQALTSPAPFLAYVDPVTMAGAAFEYLSSPKQFEAAVKQSEVMKHRVMSPILEAIRKAKMDPGVNKALATVSDLGMKGLEAVDWLSVSIGWKAVYNSAQGKISKGGEFATIGAKTYRVQPGEHQEHVYTASEIADDITLECQPSADPADLAPLFKSKGKGGEALKAFTQFQSALNVIYQQISYDVPNAIKNKRLGAAVRMIGAYVLAGILVGMVSRGPEDDDDDKRDDVAFWAMTQFTDSVPLVSSYVTGLAKKVVTGSNERPYQSPMFPFVSEIYAGSINVTDGDWQKAAQNFAEAVGYGVGLPVSGVKEAIRAGEEGPGALVGRRN